MSNKLEGKIALVTGGSSGIGLATAKELAAQGARVIITGRRKDEVEKAAMEIPATGILSDQSKVSNISDLADQVKYTFGHLDILFINAGIVLFSSIADASEEHFDTMTDINFKGSYFMLSKMIPLLSKGASVTVLSSVNATTGQSNCSVYSASKAALNAMVKVAATELAPKGIRVNAVSPGPIVTNLVVAAGIDEATKKDFASRTLKAIPLGRFGQPEEVAKLVAFLSSGDAAFITGAEYFIDGGVTINAIAG